MSATNRGTERNPYDFYETPKWLVEAIIPHLRKYLAACATDVLRIWEPACGGGAITNILKLAFPGHKIVGSDLQAQSAGVELDFLSYEGESKFDLIITNPPYSLAMEFIEHALKFMRNEHSLVFMLLRVNFLGSRQRAKWLREHPPRMHVTPRRPSFTGQGHDATEYAWFGWQKPYEDFSGIVMLDTEDTLTEQQQHRLVGAKYKAKLKALAKQNKEEEKISQMLDRRKKSRIRKKYNAKLRALMKMRKKEAVMDIW